MKQLVSIVTIIGMAFGAYFFLDSRYAKCGDVKAIERRLDVKIEGDILNQQQNRLWAMEDRYGSDPDKIQDQDKRQQMKELKVNIENQRNRVRSLESK